MSDSKIDILQRALQREKAARKQAEKILEEKSTDLYELSQQLSETNIRLEKSIQRKTSELKGLFEHIIDAYIVIDLQGNIMNMNDAAKEMFGYDIAKEKVSLLTLVYEKDKQQAREALDELKKQGVLKGYQVRILTKQKTLLTVQINCSLVFDEHKTAIAAQGIFRDISAEKSAENKLISSENRLATLIQNLDTGVLLEDENRDVVLTNHELCNLFQITATPDEMKGNSSLLSTEKRNTLFKNVEVFVARVDTIIKAKKTVLREEVEMLDGRVLERDYVPIFDEEIYQGHLWSYRDVTLRKKYHQSIEAEKQKYSNIIANMNLGLLEVNTDDKIMMANQCFVEMSGYDEKELLGKIAKEVLVPKAHKNKILTENIKRTQGESNSYELKIHNKQGEKRYWLISGAPNYNINGQVIGSIGVHLDITDLKKLQEQKEKLLSKLEKSNQELEEYAHIVSHDLKSPLRSINALVNWLKADNIEVLNETSLQHISLIESTLEKMEKLISEILNYSSIQAEVNKESEKTEVDLNTVIIDLREILFIPDHISLVVHHQLPVISGSSIKFQQLFQNIISNAIRYIDKPVGLIEIDVIEQPSFYQFSIKDNGIGIEKKHHEKIFKIFQSLGTHEASTGIGLSIVKKIIDLHGGEIWLESTPGIGTTFYFTLIK